MDFESYSASLAFSSSIKDQIFQWKRLRRQALDAIAHRTTPGPYANELRRAISQGHSPEAVHFYYLQKEIYAVAELYNRYIFMLEALLPPEPIIVRRNETT